MFVRDGVSYCRWPYGRDFSPVKKEYTKTAQDINGNNVEIKCTNYDYRLADWDQMAADRNMRLIIKCILSIIAIAAIITLVGMTVHARWKIQQMKIGKI